MRRITSQKRPRARRNRLRTPLEKPKITLKKRDLTSPIEAVVRNNNFFIWACASLIYPMNFTEGMESMKESAERPESHEESRGILGTIRDWVTPEFAETPKSKY